MGRSVGQRRAGRGTGPVCAADGLGDLDLVARTFGEEILPLWQGEHGSNLVVGGREGLVACQRGVPVSAGCGRGVVVVRR